MGKFVKKITTSRYYASVFRKNKEQISKLYSLLADQKSKDTLSGILSAYKAVFRTPEYYFTKTADGECSYYHFTTPEGYQVCGTTNPYFLDDIFTLNSEMVYLDGGAYIGDTIQLLFGILGEPCKYTYAFEPNEDNFKQMKEAVKDHLSRVQCLNVGLDNHDGVVSFLKADSGSKVSADGTEQIHVMDAGKFLATQAEHLPTFIKLDIEGKEKDVIDAMRDFIRSNHPDLAISVYHRLEDLWEIPLQIHRINPNYKIYLRHQSNYFTETVCYATQ